MFEIFQNALASHSATFYIFAVIGVILMGLSKSGFGAGIGFLAVPLIASQSNVNTALAIMLPLLVATDLMGIGIYIKKFDRSLMKWMIPAGLLGVLTGIMFFKEITPELLSIAIGIFTLVFLIQRLWLGYKSKDKNNTTATDIGISNSQSLSLLQKISGFLLATTSGFTSFIAHNGGPPISAFMIPLRLEPLVYTATLGIFFAFINFTKWIPYAYLGLLHFDQMAVAIILLPCVPIGVYLGFYAAKKLPQKTYYKIVYIAMFFGGIKMILDGIN